MNFSKLANSSEIAVKKKRGPGRPWPKGVSGNAKGGRPKSRPITDMFKRILDNPDEAEQIQENVAATLKSKGMAGVILLSHIADRLEGKMPEEVTINDLRELSDEELEARAKKLDAANT